MKCAKCGATWEEAIDGKMFSYCPYCGSALEISEEIFKPVVVTEKPEHLIGLNKFTSGGVVRHVWEWLATLRNVPPKVALQSPECVYYPYWVVVCFVTTYWKGKQQRSRTVREADSWKTEYYWVPDSGQFRYQYSVPVMARVGSEPWWHPALFARSVWLKREWAGAKGWRSWWGRLWRCGATYREHNVDLLVNTEPLTDDKISRVGLFRPNVTAESAQERTKAYLESLQFEEAKRKVTSLEECHHSICYLRTALVHVPFWSLQLVYSDKKYPIVVLGSTGEIISATIPVV